MTVTPRLVALIVEPETAPAGTVTTTLLAVKIENGAATVPILMLEAEAMFVPFSVKVEPTYLTNDAVKVIVGLLVLVVLALNSELAEAVPPPVVTFRLPF